MSRRGQPTLAALHARVQKKRHREIGNVLARRWARPTAVWGTWLAVRLGLSAHLVTLLALGTSLVSAFTIGWGTPTSFIVGVVLAFLAFWLDHVDGQVARWRRTASLDGVYLDYLMHHSIALTQGFALGYGLTNRTDDPRWTLAGFSIACGWALLSLQNDCRYKAFFQELKRSRRTYRVVGGSGGRPSPPDPWPRHGLRAFTWPAYKICEPHCVLTGLAVLGLLAWIAEPIWEAAWMIGTLGMAILAPALAVARAARVVLKGSVASEFSRWFQVGEAP